MAAIANLVLKDGHTPPSDRTFTPTTASLDLAVWQERVGGIYTGMPTVQLSSRKPLKGSPLFKVKGTIKLPVMEVVSNSTINGIAPAPTIAYSLQAMFEILVPERSKLQDRTDILALLNSLTADSQVQSLVHNFESPY